RAKLGETPKMAVTLSAPSASTARARSVAESTPPEKATPRGLCDKSAVRTSWAAERAAASASFGVEVCVVISAPIFLIQYSSQLVVGALLQFFIRGPQPGRGSGNIEDFL